MYNADQPILNVGTATSQLFNLIKRQLKLSIKKFLLLAIVDADVFLEWAKLWAIGQINYQTNGLQHRLFLLSMSVDRRLDN
jgi:hypothetical protein